MPQAIRSPHRYPERLTVMGYEGAGKSSLVHNILRYQLDAHAWVIDLDYSFAHERLMASEYPEIEDRLHIYTIDQEWDEFASTFKEILANGDPKRGDWLVIDPTTATWSMVQSYFVGKAYGDEIGEHLVGLKQRQQEAKEAAETDKEKEDARKQFGREQVEEMSWPVINKLYQDNFYGLFHRWRGNSILVCEAEPLRKDASDKEKEQFGWLGHKPKGQKTMPFVSATNIYLEHLRVSGKDVYKMTTTKDRGRPLIERKMFDEFAMDYLVEHGGWEMYVAK